MSQAVPEKKHKARAGGLLGRRLAKITSGLVSTTTSGNSAKIKNANTTTVTAANANSNGDAGQSSSMRQVLRTMAKSVLTPRTAQYYSERKQFADQHENFRFLKDVPIYCICLQEHEDRYQHCVKEFEKVGILPWVRFYRPKRDPEGGLAGCWRSHDAVVRMAYSETQAPYALIFEDDVVFSKKWARAAPYIKHFLETEPDWHYFRLGCMFVHSYDDCAKSCPHQIWRMASTATHAYFVSRPMMEAWVQRAKFQGRGVDHDMILATTKDYVLKQAIVWQSGKFESSIHWGAPGSAGDKCQKIVQGMVDYEAWQKAHNRSIVALSMIPKAIRPSFHLFESDKTFHLPADGAPALLLK